MKKLLLAAAVGLAVSAPQFAAAQNSPLSMRVRAVNIDPADKSDAIPALGVPADAITVSSKVIPEVDFTYFFTKNFAAELVLTVPQRHTVKLSGTDIGTFKHLPPTLTAQYHFLPDNVVSPYVGAGVNLTLLSSVKLNVPGVGDLDLDDSSVGYALQGGVDFKFDKNWSANFDVKYVQIESDVKLKATGATVSKVEVSPVLIGVGVGYRF
jgi:outer membrane protein